MMEGVQDNSVRFARLYSDIINFFDVETCLQISIPLLDLVLCVCMKFSTISSPSRLEHM